MALMTIINAPAWQHHLVFSYPLILVFLAEELRQEKKRKTWIISIGLLIWLVMAFHFKNENNPLLFNPFIASYQTILIILLLGFLLCRYFLRRST